MLEDFSTTFEQLTGHQPYPWQKQLFCAFLSNCLPKALDIPTGLGKTSVMAIWLIAHLLGENNVRPPMRLIYVVNRRTIVDQATEEAIRLGERLSPQDKKILAGTEDWQLPISTLRGALADNGDWLLSPHRPSIIVGTVDMIGSRLLFNGYRTGRWQKSRHAGLLGCDALLVHDEAHLSKPFQTMLDWSAGQQRNHPRRLQIMPMSATGGDSDGNEVLRIGDEDRDKACDKLQAVKRVHLHDCKEKLDAAKLVELAMAHKDENARIIIFARTPDVADKVVSELAKEKIGREQIALLTGTIRGYERDKLVDNPVLRHLLQGWGNDQPQTEYLVATSAGEVGADFDADHLVCDLSTMDAMIQRIGRVNRRGGQERKAQIDVLLDIPAVKSDKEGKPKNLRPIESARITSAAFLKALEAEQGDGFDASPEAIGKWRERPNYAAACEPSVPTITPHDVTLDAWSLTSIQSDWPVAQDVHPYLHGLEESPPETYVAWRSELDEWTSSDETEVDARAFEQLLAHYPLRPRELLRDKPEKVAELLLAMRERCGEKPVVLMRNRSVTLLKWGDYSDSKALARDIGYCTVILAACAGGLGSAGMIDAKSGDQVVDVADAGVTNGNDAPVERRRVVLQRNDDREWTGGILAGDERIDAAYDKWTAARDAWSRPLNMRNVGRIVLSRDEEEQPNRLLLLFVQRDEKASVEPQKLLINAHNDQVFDTVREIVEQIGLGETEAMALALAAQHHDLGKGWDYADGRWQKAVGNTDADEAWAKTFNNVPNWRLLDGYRHEFGSLLAALKSEAVQQPDEQTRDLALHLVATHHGRGRSHFDLSAMKTPLDNLPGELKPAEIARRFDRLQRRYGHWGLAWLESLLMAADAIASRDATSQTDEDQDADQEREQ